MCYGLMLTICGKVHVFFLVERSFFLPRCRLDGLWNARGCTKPTFPFANQETSSLPKTYPTSEWNFFKEERKKALAIKAAWLGNSHVSGPRLITLENWNM